MNDRAARLVPERQVIRRVPRRVDDGQRVPPMRITLAVGERLPVDRVLGVFAPATDTSRRIAG